MTGYLITRSAELTAQNSNFMLQGAKGVALANAVTDIEFQLPQERWLSGGTVVIPAGNDGDKMDFFVAIKSGGVDVYTKKFADSIYVVPGVVTAIDEIINYTTLVPSGAFLRLRYTNAGSSNVNVVARWRTHIPADV